MLTLERLAALLADYAREAGTSVDLLLVGALAVRAYGDPHRSTHAVDGEVVGDLDGLVRFFRSRQIPVDLGEDLSRWSVVAMPPGYQERATALFDQPAVRIRLLHPTDFVVAKPRRGTEEDLGDAAFVARRFGTSTAESRAAAEEAVQASPKDTAIFLFQTTVEQFCTRLQDDLPRPGRINA